MNRPTDDTDRPFIPVEQAPSLLGRAPRQPRLRTRSRVPLHTYDRISVRTYRKPSHRHRTQHVRVLRLVMAGLRVDAAPPRSRTNHNRPAQAAAISLLPCSRRPRPKRVVCGCVEHCGVGSGGGGVRPPGTGTFLCRRRCDATALSVTTMSQYGTVEPKASMSWMSFVVHR